MLLSTPRNDRSIEKLNYYLMTQTENRAHNFEILIAELLCLLGYENVHTNVDFPGELGHNFEVDVVVIKDKSALVVAEVKAYRPTSPPQLDMVRRALDQTRNLKRRTSAPTAILAVSCIFTESMWALAENFKEVVVWDLRTLFDKALPFPDYFKNLALAFEIEPSVAMEEIVGLHRPDQSDCASVLKGVELAERFDKIEPGRKMAHSFEDACITALKYLFEGDLFGWHEQLQTEDNLHRRDLVCRVLPNAEVWKLILSDFQSRYVIFEFKNYSEQITQQEIITTERYLYPRAFRRVAIIISPLGCSENASKVIHGAMREHGKLIISVTTVELKRLLIQKDQGSDPNTFIFERIDKFLMALGR